jgi:hypothetical protein
MTRDNEPDPKNAGARFAKQVRDFSRGKFDIKMMIFSSSNKPDKCLAQGIS